MYSSVGSGTCVYRLRERRAMASSGCSAIKMPNPMPKLSLIHILYEQGDIYKGEYIGHYCKPCESFWS